MGTTTPNIGIYIPAAGETNYEAAFAAGMINIDQHDHSGGPNKGLPIATSGIADFSITYNKLNANVVDPTTGIGVSGTLPNQLQILGLLKNIFQIPTASGFIAKNGSLATARTFQDTATIAWTNPAGISGNPSASLVSGSFVSSVTGTANQIAVSPTTGATVVSLAPIVKNATQPLFSASITTPQTNVTGNGTVYQVLFPVVEVNQGSYYDAGTSKFTAPIAGNYLFGCNIYIPGFQPAADNIQIDIYKNNAYFDTLVYLLFDDDSMISVQQSGSRLMALALNDVIDIRVTVTGGPKVTAINLGNFNGFLVA